MGIYTCTHIYTYIHSPRTTRGSCRLHMHMYIYVHALDCTPRTTRGSLPLAPATRHERGMPSHHARPWSCTCICTCVYMHMPLTAHARPRAYAHVSGTLTHVCRARCAGLTSASNRALRRRHTSGTTPSTAGTTAWLSISSARPEAGLLLGSPF